MRLQLSVPLVATALLALLGGPACKGKDRPASRSAATAEGDAPDPCAATIATPFHLRPVATADSVGTAYPPGTKVTILGLADPPLTRNEQRLFHVEVIADKKLGYVFVGPKDLPPKCDNMKPEAAAAPAPADPAAAPADPAAAPADPAAAPADPAAAPATK